VLYLYSNLILESSLIVGGFSTRFNDNSEVVYFYWATL